MDGSVRTFVSGALKRVAKAFPAGPVTGLFFFCALFVAGLFWNAGFSVMGVQQSDVAKLVMSSFWPWVVCAQLKILFVALVIGYCLGWIAELSAAAIAVPLPFFRFSWIFCVNLWALLYSITKYPQLYVESIYSRGHAGMALQGYITDRMPAGVFAVLAFLVVAPVAFAVGLWLARKLKTRIYIVGLLVIAAVALMANSHRVSPALNNRGPNILIIAADSLRKDRLYEGGLTPNITKLADEGMRFHSQFTSLPRTFPAVISLLSGKLPVTHGVRHMFPNRWLRDHRDGSLPETLRKKGYATAVVSDFAGDVFSRMQIGFERIRVPYFNFITLIDQRSLEMHFLLAPYLTNTAGRAVFPELKEFANNADPLLLADETISELGRASNRERFCTMVFFSNLHFPYAAPYPYYRSRTVAGYEGRYKYHKPPTLYDKEKLDERDIRQIRGLYDGSLEALDAAVGKIVAWLKRRGLYENTIIIITADHGENLYESNWTIGHGEHLRGDHVINVPLIIRLPEAMRKNIPPRDITCVTRDVDLTPTLFELLGVRQPAGMDGRSLMPLLCGEKDDLGLTAFAETGVWFSDISEGFYQQERIMYPDITGISKIDFACNLEVVLKDEYEDLVRVAKHRMVDDGRYRLIYVPTISGIQYQLYERPSDPLFEHDCAGREPGRTAALKKILNADMRKDASITFRNGYAVPAGGGQ